MKVKMCTNFEQAIPQFSGNWIYDAEYNYLSVNMPPTNDSIPLI